MTPVTKVNGFDADDGKDNTIVGLADGWNDRSEYKLSSNVFLLSPARNAALQLRQPGTEGAHPS